MTRSMIQKLREKYDKSGIGNGDPELEAALLLYVERQIGIGEKTSDAAVRCDAQRLIDDASGMLDNLRSRYFRPGSIEGER